MRPDATPPRLGHVALTASDPRRLGAFYSNLLDLQIVRMTTNRQVGEAVLLSGNPDREDHELVFLTNPAAPHIAFRVNTLDRLGRLYTSVKERDIPIPYALDSGFAVGFFVRDPEGNAVEIYVARREPGRGRPALSDSEEIDELILGSPDAAE